LSDTVDPGTTLGAELPDRCEQALQGQNATFGLKNYILERQDIALRPQKMATIRHSARRNFGAASANKTPNWAFNPMKKAPPQRSLWYSQR